MKMSKALLAVSSFSLLNLLMITPSNKEASQVSFSLKVFDENEGKAAIVVNTLNSSFMTERTNAYLSKLFRLPAND